MSVMLQACLQQIAMSQPPGSESTQGPSAALAPAACPAGRWSWRQKVGTCLPLRLCPHSSMQAAQAHPACELPQRGAKPPPAPSSSACSWPAPSPFVCNQPGHAAGAGLQGRRMWGCFEWQVDFAVGTEMQTPKQWGWTGSAQCSPPAQTSSCPPALGFAAWR